MSYPFVLFEHVKNNRAMQKLRTKSLMIYNYVVYVTYYKKWRKLKKNSNTTQLIAMSITELGEWRLNLFFSDWVSGWTATPAHQNI